VNVYQFIDNPCVPNKFEQNDLKIKSTRTKTRGSKKKQRDNEKERITKIIYNYYRKLHEEKDKPNPPPVGVADPSAFYPIASEN
jgi:hypothetical protein